MNTASFWKGTAQEVSFSSLSQDLDTDVAIIGGGITGITAAHLLAQAGKSVVVLEAMKVGLGTTGHSTGNLHVTVDQSLSAIRNTWDQKTATAVARSRSETIDAIERVVAEYNIPCNFFRRPHYIFPTDSSQVPQMEQEYRTLRDAGVDATIIREVPLPFRVEQALRIEHQAQFHPLMYVRMLAKAIATDRCRIFEDSKVIEIDDDRMTVSTAHGKVRAEAIIMAMHTPKGFNVLQTELGPYREYGIAARLTDDRYPEGLF
ncbi:MAG: FAD-dependent oxidoreductase [Nitrospirota bacterium]